MFVFIAFREFGASCDRKILKYLKLASEVSVTVLQGYVKTEKKKKFLRIFERLIEIMKTLCYVQKRASF